MSSLFSDASWRGGLAIHAWGLRRGHGSEGGGVTGFQGSWRCDHAELVPSQRHRRNRRRRNCIDTDHRDEESVVYSQDPSPPQTPSPKRRGSRDSRQKYSCMGRRGTPLPQGGDVNRYGAAIAAREGYVITYAQPADVGGSNPGRCSLA